MDSLHYNRSLRWQLSWRLSVVFVIVVATVIVGLCVYGALILSPNVGLKNRLEAAVESALSRSPDGRLLISETDNLADFKADNQRLWFVAALHDGTHASYGSVPEAYLSIAPVLHLVREADIRGVDDRGEAASIDTMSTGIGQARVMYGGNSTLSGTFLTMLMGTYPIYAPLLLVALPAIFITIPIIVRGSLRGTRSVVELAPRIDPLKGGVRLPTKGIPREIVPLVAAFNAILERLEKQLESRRRFLIDAAHELRTPITIMQTRIDGMEDGGERSRLMADVERLADTAEQLLDFERIDQSPQSLEAVELVEFCREIIAEFAPVAILAGHEISFNHDSDQVVIQGNMQSLKRAVMNLLRNAVDHGAGEGEISLTVTTDRRIIVSDSGPGISVEHQAQVFEPFYRVRPKNSGAGLGLSLVRSIVSNHQGAVSLVSSPAGSVFTMQF